jgi:hypothetical protein
MCACQIENSNIINTYRTRLNDIKSLDNIQTDDIMKLIEKLNELRYEILTDINDPSKSGVKDELNKIKKSVDITLVNIYNVANALIASDDVEITFMHVKLK